MKLSDLIHPPYQKRSAYIEFHNLSDTKSSLETTNDRDLWSYAWGADYSISKAYAAFMERKNLCHSLMPLTGS
jgi:hypothetical protein